MVADQSVSSSAGDSSITRLEEETRKASADMLTNVNSFMVQMGGLMSGPKIQKCVASIADIVRDANENLNKNAGVLADGIRDTINGQLKNNNSDERVSASFTPKSINPDISPVKLAFDNGKVGIRNVNEDPETVISEFVKTAKQFLMSGTNLSGAIRGLQAWNEVASTKAGKAGETMMGIPADTMEKVKKELREFWAKDAEIQGRFGEQTEEMFDKLIASASSGANH